jgi:hypothetical protein
MVRVKEMVRVRVRVRVKVRVRVRMSVRNRTDRFHDIENSRQMDGRY